MKTSAASVFDYVTRFISTASGLHGRMRLRSSNLIGWETLNMSRTILITGASSGFGRDTAETLSRAGHRVFASMRDVAGRNRPHADALRASGVQVVELDVTDDASVERGVASVLENSGRLDVLINNAGIGSAGVSEAFTTKQVQALFDVNVFGIQRMSRAVLPTFRKQREGLIMNIGSILGRVTFPFFGLYGASKFAIEALTDSYRYELSTLGIDVVLVQPSNYPTNIFASAQRPADAARVPGYGEAGAIPDKMVETLMALFASDHAPDPHDVAEAIAQLVEQAPGTRPARWVVGQSFGADALNAQAAAIQAQTLESLGLAHLAGPQGQSAAA
ncbi:MULTISPECIES: SDR family oxidoreductase [Burkholderia]|uniref:SDR family oxidoreductase n=2 Tax=Burkholderiaceae TaxID=119060 RepID=UPI0021B079B1|nr:SDR family oxidoreductase [Burkholderia cenocepacia]